MVLLLCLLLQAPLNTTHSTSFVVFGSDTNSNPPMCFGGKLFSEMDRTAAICMRRLLYASTVKTYVTKSAAIEYKRPAYVGELLVVTAKVTALGETSVTMSVTIERENPPGTRVPDRELITKGEFVFVSYDVDKRASTPHGLKLP